MAGMIHLTVRYTKAQWWVTELPLTPANVAPRIKGFFPVGGISRQVQFSFAIGPHQNSD